MVSVPSQMYEVRNARTQQLVASHASFAASWRTRMVGLLGRRALPDGEALIFPRCRAIHTIGMRFPIDAIFIDRAWRVVALRPALAPGLPAIWAWDAWGVIEAAQGTIASAQLRIGDQLEKGSGTIPAKGA